MVENYSDFKKFSEIGKELADLHLNYETLETDSRIKVIGTDSQNFKVEKLKYAKKGDTSRLIYNSYITLDNIPKEAFLYEVNGRTPVDWIIDRYQVKIDKDSGIVNDPNDWGIEHGNPRYILDLLLSVITLSIKTNELIGGLPKIKFE